MVESWKFNIYKTKKLLSRVVYIQWKQICSVLTSIIKFIYNKNKLN